VGGKILLRIVLDVLFVENHCFVYSFWMRLSSRKNPLWLIAKLKMRKLSRLYGIQINGSNIGPGLYIGHGVGYATLIISQ
jgi:serine acetyltransferase